MQHSDEAARAIEAFWFRMADRDLLYLKRADSVRRAAARLVGAAWPEGVLLGEYAPGQSESVFRLSSRPAVPFSIQLYRDGEWHDQCRFITAGPALRPGVRTVEHVPCVYWTREAWSKIVHRMHAWDTPGLRQLLIEHIGPESASLGLSTLRHRRRIECLFTPADAQGACGPTERCLIEPITPAVRVTFENRAALEGSGQCLVVRFENLGFVDPPKPTVHWRRRSRGPVSSSYELTPGKTLEVKIENIQTGEDITVDFDSPLRIVQQSTLGSHVFETREVLDRQVTHQFAPRSLPPTASRDERNVQSRRPRDGKQFPSATSSPEQPVFVSKDEVMPAASEIGVSPEQVPWHLIEQFLAVRASKEAGFATLTWDAFIERPQDYLLLTGDAGSRRLVHGLGLDMISPLTAIRQLATVVSTNGQQAAIEQFLDKAGEDEVQSWCSELSTDVEAGVYLCERARRGWKDRPVESSRELVATLEKLGRLDFQVIENCLVPDCLVPDQDLPLKISLGRCQEAVTKALEITGGKTEIVSARNEVEAFCRQLAEHIGQLRKSRPDLEELRIFWTSLEDLNRNRLPEVALRWQQALSACAATAFPLPEDMAVPCWLELDRRIMARYHSDREARLIQFQGATTWLADVLEHRQLVDQGPLPYPAAPERISRLSELSAAFQQDLPHFDLRFAARLGLPLDELAERLGEKCDDVDRCLDGVDDPAKTVVSEVLSKLREVLPRAAWLCATASCLETLATEHARLEALSFCQPLRGQARQDLDHLKELVGQPLHKWNGGYEALHRLDQLINDQTVSLTQWRQLLGGLSRPLQDALRQQNVTAQQVGAPEALDALAIWIGSGAFTAARDGISVRLTEMSKLAGPLRNLVARLGVVKTTTPREEEAHSLSANTPLVYRDQCLALLEFEQSVSKQLQAQSSQLADLHSLRAHAEQKMRQAWQQCLVFRGTSIERTLDEDLLAAVCRLLDEGEPELECFERVLNQIEILAEVVCVRRELDAESGVSLAELLLLEDDWDLGTDQPWWRALRELVAVVRQTDALVREPGRLELASRLHQEAVEHAKGSSWHRLARRMVSLLMRPCHDLCTNLKARPNLSPMWRPPVFNGKETECFDLLRWLRLRPTPNSGIHDAIPAVLRPLIQTAPAAAEAVPVVSQETPGGQTSRVAPPSLQAAPPAAQSWS